MSAAITQAAPIIKTILLVGADASEFPRLDLNLLRSGRVLQWSKHDVRPKTSIPDGIETVIYCMPNIGRDKAFQLQNIIRQTPGVEGIECSTQTQLHGRLKEKMTLAPPVKPSEEIRVGGPQQPSGSVISIADAGNSAGNAALEENLEEQSSGAAAPAAERQVKLPPAGTTWKLPELVHKNANPHAVSISEEVAWLLKACHQNGFPNATRLNIDSHFRNVRKKAGVLVAGHVSGKTAVVIPAAQLSPQVTDYLNRLQQLTADLPGFLQAFAAERAAFVEETERLRAENNAFEQRLANAKQAASLLQNM